MKKIVVEDGVQLIDASFSHINSETIQIWLPDSISGIASIAFFQQAVVIHCKEGSYAHTYAVKERIPHALIDKQEVTNT